MPFRKVMRVALYACVATIIACSDEQVEHLDEFELADNLKIELVAKEPLLVSPVAVAQDPQGRMWAAEMPGFMRDINGSGEEIADGRIVILSDTDHDGVMDDRQVVIDGLLNPRAVSFAYGGVLFTDGPMLKWALLVDNLPGPAEVIDSFYALGGNIEHQPNGLLYGLDNWIYSAKSNARYRKRNGEWLKEPTTFRGQWGISMDRNGRLIYNHNSIAFAADYAMPNQQLHNPNLKLNYSHGVKMTDDRRIYPVSHASVNRGYEEGVLDSTGRVMHYTSSCAPHIYYGSGLGIDLHNTAFVCAPEANLVANYQLSQSPMDLSATRVGTTEFLASHDETFRPVNLFTGYDGGLYIVDMRKGIIQHRAYMTSYLRNLILEKELEKVHEKGRIYRVTSRDSQDSMRDLSDDRMPELLKHENLAVRMYAQRRLIHLADPELLKSVAQMATDMSSPVGQVHAMWTLEGVDASVQQILTDVLALSDSPFVIYHALAVAKAVGMRFDQLSELMISLKDRDNRFIDFGLALFVRPDSEAPLETWLALATKYVNDNVIVEALLSSAYTFEETLLSRLPAAVDGDSISVGLHNIIQNRNAGREFTPVILTEPFDDDRTTGLKAFHTKCAVCHGVDGAGMSGVGPSLVNSNVLTGSSQSIAEVILYGYKSGSSDYPIPMPSYGDDPTFSNEELLGLVSYVQSAFTTNWSDLSTTQIDSLRKLEK